MNGSEPTKIAVACQGGGTHAAFEAGVLTEILKDLEQTNRFKLIGLSGTSAGALCALMVWYGLAPIKGRPESGSVPNAIRTLNEFWDGFASTTPAEIVHNTISMTALKAQEQEVPVLGINAPIFSFNPRGVFSHAVVAELLNAGVRKDYLEFDNMLQQACPHFKQIDWATVQTRLLLGASEIVNGYETAFDSDCNDKAHDYKHYESSVKHVWRRRLPITLDGVAASGTLPAVLEARKIGDLYYWDGLYSQNPPVREFFSGTKAEYVPDEIWIVRINPQQAPERPQSNAEIQDRENELMGNLSLNKELDFLLAVNKLLEDLPEEKKQRYKPVKVRTIKMTQATAAELRTSSKYNRSRYFIDKLRKEGHEVARAWLNAYEKHRHSEEFMYPDDAAYYPPPSPTRRSGQTVSDRKKWPEGMELAREPVGLDSHTQPQSGH